MNALQEQECATDWVGKADAAFADGNFAEAQWCLSAALDEDPGNAELALALGHFKLSAGDLPGALADYTHATLKKPHWAAGHASRALALQLLQRPHEAETEAQKSLALDSHDLVALKVLARIRLDSGQFADARNYCRRVLSSSPNDGDAAKMMDESLVALTTLSPAPLPASPSPGASQGRPGRSATAFSRGVGPEDLSELKGLAGDYSSRTEAWQALGAEHLLQQLVVGDFEKQIEIFPKPAQSAPGPDGFPVPPVELTMGYGAGNMDHYLACGRKSYDVLTKILQAHRVDLAAGDSLLDWGCAAGRVVRTFSAEAKRGCQVWGCDVHTPSIRWAQAHLAPPFQFCNSSSLPHLGFPEETFKFIYGLSVMTHLIALRDLWLLELRRVLRPDGCLVLTVHDESTWDWFRAHGMPHWMPAELRSAAELRGECLEIRGSRWDHCYTFFHSDYVRRVWGQFFEVAQIVPCADSYQSAVVLRKRR